MIVGRIKVDESGAASDGRGGFSTLRVDQFVELEHQQARKAPAQLNNGRHAHKPEGREYCDRSLQGQFILVEGDRTYDHDGTVKTPSHYVRYATEHFTRNVDCPDTGAVK